MSSSMDEAEKAIRDAMEQAQSSIRNAMGPTGKPAGDAPQHFEGEMDTEAMRPFDAAIAQAEESVRSAMAQVDEAMRQASEAISSIGPK